MGREKATGLGALPLPFQFLAAWVGVRVARHQTDQIEYLRTVNRALMERAGKKRLRFNDAERRKPENLWDPNGHQAALEFAAGLVLGSQVINGVSLWFVNTIATNATAAGEATLAKEANLAFDRAARSILTPVGIFTPLPGIRALRDTISCEFRLLGAGVTSNMEPIPAGRYHRRACER